MRKLLLALVWSLLVLPSSLLGQQAPTGQPTTMVISLNKCNLARTQEMNEWFRTAAAPILNDLVREGRLAGWGVIEHVWGDEWNSGIYYMARDIQTFHGAFNEYLRRLLEREPEVMQRFERYCSEHKDNIYTVVMTDRTTGDQNR